MKINSKKLAVIPFLYYDTFEKLYSDDCKKKVDVISLDLINSNLIPKDFLKKFNVDVHFYFTIVKKS